ncbi:MAG: hypothetical protein K2X32_10715 [Phycisphaerales bacterium]|nr:hypothetical protein [Phycisphaerales bacterium]
MATSVPVPTDPLQRMVYAVELVRQRMLKATAALRGAGVSHCVVGGNAVAAWVATVDVAAVRNTQDVDILLRRDDLPAARAALEAAGFVYRHAASLDMFLDSAEASPRSAIHLLFAGERVRPDDLTANPEVAESGDIGGLSVVSLEALVRVKLTVFRRKDQVHLLDMLSVGLIDGSWVARMPGELGQRLQQLIDTPEG